MKIPKRFRHRTGSGLMTTTGRALVLLALLSLTPAAPLVRASDLPRHLLEDERNTITVFQEASKSVVFITNNELRRNYWSRNVMEVPRGSGSGFVWNEDGYIVTNYHVIRGGDRLYVTLSDGTGLEAELVGFDQNVDLAVLKVPTDEKLDYIRLGDSDELLVGQKVLAIGNPFGLDQTLTTGVISALGREIQSVAGTTISDVIQTDASINPGNSGGPLLDSAGRLIGVNTSIFSTSGSSAGIGFAVPVSAVRRVVPQLIEKGYVSRAGLGVLLVSDDLARRWGVHGVIIREVQTGSAADEAGLRGIRYDRRRRVTLGDVIIGIDGKSVETYNDLYTALSRYEPGERVKVRIARGDDQSEVKLRLQEIH